MVSVEHRLESTQAMIVIGSCPKRRFDEHVWVFWHVLAPKSFTHMEDFRGRCFHFAVFFLTLNGLEEDSSPHFHHWELTLCSFAAILYSCKAVVLTCSPDGSHLGLLPTRPVQLCNLTGALLSPSLGETISGRGWAILQLGSTTSPTLKGLPNGRVNAGIFFTGMPKGVE